MLICGKKVDSATGTFLILLIFGLTFASYFWKRSTVQHDINRKTSWLKPHNHCYRGQPITDTITQLEDNHSFIIAPYFDHRSELLIRVISIVHHEKVKELYCLFCCQDYNSSIIMVKANIDIHKDRFAFPYGTADLLCLEPQNCYPRYMSVRTSLELNFAQVPIFEIQNQNIESPPLEFTVCISTMFGGYNNILQFVQSIEMYKILGAQKMVIYKNKCSQLMEKVLEYYVSEGIIEIIPWPIHLYLSVSAYWHYSMDAKDIGYYGQITALNDCVYRNMYRSKYVLLNDVDEIILPIKDADWKSLMQRLQEQNPGRGVFLFENHVFRNTVSAPTSPFNFSSWSPVPGVNMFQHIYKEPNRKSDFNNKKMVVDPRKVIQTSIHSVLKMYGDPVEVSSEIAINFHCRIPERKDVPNEALIRDTILWRYNTTLIANINKVLHKSNILESNTKL
ncbi:uncharacterized protein LOC133373642 isoform X2 [Rhineura floridana]|uniref:uncharacterized protein LOC133373642 isoform X2 n=1 Tax=Rhineura floridana TaxID=261503 RepID=UPI002AC866DA|nr:uncharacterized protein LOC133373642 isoform X2 [Rhineura floridana]XP_061459528.1 uncharacterized protein LOC133373642 isoform X2 [Rhineura floridana]